MSALKTREASAATLMILQFAHDIYSALQFIYAHRARPPRRVNLLLVQSRYWRSVRSGSCNISPRVGFPYCICRSLYSATGFYSVDPSARRSALMNVTPAGPDLFHRVPKSKQQRLAERLLILTMLSSSVTQLFKVFLALQGTGVPSPCSPKSDIVLYVAWASDVRSTYSQLTGIRCRFTFTYPKRHLSKKSSV